MDRVQLSNLFYRSRRLTVLVLGLSLVAGLSALEALPRQEDPTLSRRFASITTYYPGSSALRVESQVTRELEQRLRELHEVKEVLSRSRTGVSVVRVELDDHYSEVDVDAIWSRVRDKLREAEASFPDGVGRPELETRTTTAVTLLVGLAWMAGAEPQLEVLSRLAEELESRLRNVPGTKETELFGEVEEELRVDVDPLLLASVGLTARELSAAIEGGDSKLPAGQLRAGSTDLLLEVAGELTSVERVRRIPVRSVSGVSLLRVGDIASVRKARREPAQTLALLGGERGVAVAATMEPDLRVDRWALSAKRVIEEFRSEVPAGVSLDVIFDQSGYTEKRLSSLAGNLVVGALVVFVVLAVLMGVRSALIVGSALPVTLALVLAELNLLGVPLHQTSITGLIIALGLLIDNAIVVVDEFRARLREGLTRAAAVSETVRHLFVPLAASTFTTLLAFLPIALMSGGPGEFVGSIAIGVGLSVVTSFLLSMTVIAGLSGYFAQSPQPASSARWWRDGVSSRKLLAVYRRVLRVSLGRPWVGISVSLVLPLCGFAVSGLLAEQFFPANDRDQFQVQLSLASQASVAETRQNVERARAIIHAHDQVVESHWFIGESPPRVFYNMLGGKDGQSSFAGGFVRTSSDLATEELLPGLQRELMQAFPNARVVALPFEQGPPVEAPIELRLVGSDLDVLRRLGNELRRLIAETPGITYTSATLEAGEPKLVIAADEDATRQAGLKLADVADQLQANLEGVLGGSVLEADQELPVRVRVLDAYRVTPTTIAGSRLLAASRATAEAGAGILGVPVNAVSRLELVPALAEVPRRDGERINAIQAFTLPYATTSLILADVEARLARAEFELPRGIRLELGGETAERGEAVSKLLVFALPLFVIMVGAIVLTFNSFRLAAIIFAVAGLSVGLSMLGLWLFGHPLGFVAIVGTMGLVGLAINDAIVVLNALRTDRRAGFHDVRAIEEVVVDATRHIIATTLTTLGGFLPLILAGGRFWPPMATAIATGVLGATILALFFVPAVYVLLRPSRCSRWRVWRVLAPIGSRGEATA